MSIQQLVIQNQRADCPPAIIHSGTRRLISTGARYNAFPVATTLADGRVLVAYADFEDHYGGANPVARYSIGNAAGTSWGAPGVMHQAADARWSPSGIARRGNTLVALMRRDRTTAPTYSGWAVRTTSPTSWPTPATQVTWGEPAMVPSHLSWVEDGSSQGLLLATAYWGLTGVKVDGSSDGGVTWHRRSHPMPGNAGWSESTIVQTARGDLLMLVRKDAGVNADTIHALWSSDWGMSWSKPLPVIPRASGMPTMTLLPDGRIVAVIRDVGVRRPYEPHSLAWSSDHGATWNVTPLNDEWMMYGQVVVRSNRELLMVGASQVRGISTRSDVWARPIHTLTPTLDLLGGPR